MKFSLVFIVAPLLCTTGFVACSSHETAAENDAGPLVSLGDSGFVDAPEPDGSKLLVDGGYVGPDGTVLNTDHFATHVVRFTPGGCAGFGAAEMPEVVLGPPVGRGTASGSLDVVSLGREGEIVLGFDPNAIIDRAGTDFIIFENAFWAAGDPAKPTAELAEVSVSDDGETWRTFPCVSGPGPTYGTCAGWRPVYSAPGNGISPLDPSHAGGDPFDLSEIGMTRARFVKIRDLGTMECAGRPEEPTTAGFDLDAISVVHSKSN